MKSWEFVVELDEAADRLREAKDVLERIQKAARSGRNYSIAETAGHYLKQVNEILSCDNGEAGLEPLVNVLHDEYLNSDEYKGGSK